MPSSPWTARTIWAALGIVLLVQLSLVQPTASWFGDAPHYVQHALNLAEGRPYAQTGYIHHPDNFLAPHAYPPGYPLLLAPLVGVVGVDVFSIRALNVVLFVVALGIFVWGFFGRAVFTIGGAAFVLAVGIHPFFREMIHVIGSDIAFFFFVVLSLSSYVASQREPHPRTRWLWRGVAVVGLVGAVLTRAIGIVLLPCFVLQALLRRRWSGRSLALVLTILVACAGLGLLVAGAEYLTLLRSNLLGRLDQAVTGAPGMTLRYASRLKYGLWGGLQPSIVEQALLGFSALLFAVGFVRRCTRHRSIFEVFSVVYFAALLPWTFAHTRYLLPLVPLYLGYMVLGGKWVLDTLPRPTRRYAVAASLLVVGGVIASGYAVKDVDVRPDETTFVTPNAEAFFAHVRRHTAPEAVLIAEFPRQLAFFTGRSASLPNRKPDLTQNLSYFRSIGADYVVAGVDSSPWKILEYRLADWAASHPDHFVLEHETSPFRLYRVDYGPVACRQVTRQDRRVGHAQKRTRPNGSKL